MQFVNLLCNVTSLLNIVLLHCQQLVFAVLLGAEP